MPSCQVATQQWTTRALDRSTMRLQRRDVRVEVIFIITNLLKPARPDGESEVQAAHVAMR